MGKGRGIGSREQVPPPHLIEVTITGELSGQRLDRALTALLPQLGRSRIQRLIRNGNVLAGGEPATKPAAPVTDGARVIVRLPPEPPADKPRPQDIDLDILYEDDDLSVVNKPAGLVVHAGAGHHGATLVNGLLHRYGETLSHRGGEERPGIVHRLDKGTSGLIAVARNDFAHDALAGQFKARTVEKEYFAVVYGCPERQQGRIDVAIGRDRADRTKVSANTDRPREAHTRWQRAEELDGFACLWVRPETGRMHQIRVHLAYVRHPCLGDARYAGARWKNVRDPRRREAARCFGRPALHAYRLRLEHPRSSESVEIIAPLPQDLELLRSALRSAPDEPC